MEVVLDVAIHGLNITANADGLNPNFLVFGCIAKYLLETFKISHPTNEIGLKQCNPLVEKSKGLWPFNALN